MHALHPYTKELGQRQEVLGMKNEEEKYYITKRLIRRPKERIGKGSHTRINVRRGEG